MNHNQLTHETSVEDCKRLLQMPPGPWPQGWVGYPNIAQAFREMLHEAASNTPPPPPSWPTKRGIVICGGGWRFFPSVYVTVRMIRETGCTLPIQVWFLGDRGEFDARMAEMLKDYDVGWVCANSFCRENKIPARILGGWEMKSLAALYAPFETVLYLDADSYPAYNPEEFLNHPEFQRVGAAFWPDQGGTHAGKLEPGQWERFGLEYHDEPGWESGQFIVDKSRHWRPLWASWWMNQFSDYVYKHMYGDKDTFHVCWRLCRHEVCIPSPAPGWHVVAFLQKDFSGRTLFVHRTRDKFRLTGAIDGAGINNGFMTSQSSGETRFIGGLSREQFGHDCLRECDEHLRPENFFRFVDGPRGWCQGIWHEVYTRNEYRLPKKLPADAVVVDLGAHVGAFSRLAIRRGAARVFVVEPIAANLECLRHNLGDFANRVTIIEGAATSSADSGEGVMRRSDRLFPGMTSTASLFEPDEHGETETVRLIDFDAIVAQAAASSPSGVVHLLKIDAEGAEFPCLLHSEKLHLIENMCGEVHTSQYEGLGGMELIEHLLEHLAAEGFEVRVESNGPATFSLFASRLPFVSTDSTTREGTLTHA